ncbi:MAG: hemolysin III family protein [Gemmatimonadetes bacterium]|nr:hemolysin III family protein [Gemmatimonadota bacterium]
MAAATLYRPYTLGEEISHAISHGAGLVAVLAAAPFLVIAAVGRDSWVVTGAVIYAVSLALLYTTSTLYHALTNARAKAVFKRLDHAAIFVLIAGTYTPFALGPMRGNWGWTMFAMAWVIATVGVVLKLTGRLRHPGLSNAAYLLMGWLAVAFARPFWATVPHAGVWWIAAGGLFYTLGVPFYAAKQARYTHFVWHLFVLGGTVCHFVAVIRYA